MRRQIHPRGGSQLALWYGRELYRKCNSATHEMVKAMASASINDPNHCLDVAKEARALAEFIDDPKAKSIMLQIADEYESSAKKAENEQQATAN